MKLRCTRPLVSPVRRAEPVPTVYARHTRPAFPQGRRAVCGKGAVGDRRGEGAAQGGGVRAPLRAGNAPKYLSFPSLCASRVLPSPPLPPACGRVYSSPSRRTPVDAAARTPRTGYCGRRRRSDRPFRTGLQRWLGEGCEVFHKPPSFMNSLNPLFFSTLKSLFGRRVRSWLRTNAGGAPNTCKSRGESCFGSA